MQVQYTAPAPKSQEQGAKFTTDAISTIAAVLSTVAQELAQTAKDSLPELREGERIRREWYKDGVYYRETALDGEIFLSQYDFKQREGGQCGIGSELSAAS